MTQAKYALMNQALVDAASLARIQLPMPNFSASFTLAFVAAVQEQRPGTCKLSVHDGAPVVPETFSLFEITEDEYGPSLEFVYRNDPGHDDGNAVGLRCG